MKTESVDVGDERANSENEDHYFNLVKNLGKWVSFNISSDGQWTSKGGGDSPSNEDCYKKSWEEEDKGKTEAKVEESTEGSRLSHANIFDVYEAKTKEIEDKLSLGSIV